MDTLIYLASKSPRRREILSNLGWEPVVLADPKAPRGWFAGDEEEKKLLATAWKGPFILEKTKEKPVTMTFDFSDEGLLEADEWLTKQQKLLCPGAGEEV